MATLISPSRLLLPLITAVTLALLTPELVAEQAAELPEDRQVLIKGVDRLPRSGSLPPDQATVTPFTPEDQPFSDAVRIETSGFPDRRWDLGLTATLQEPVKPDEVFLIRFWARTVDSMTGRASVAVVLERNQAPHEKLASAQFSPGSDWERFDIPFAARGDYESGQTQLSFHLGFPAQTLELGGVELVRFSDGVQVASLPRSSMAYRGMEPEATWRKAAADRIERLRMGDLRVVVRDAQGRPAADQEVRVRLARNAFQIGTAVDARLINAQTEEAERYRQAIEGHFNTVVFENDLKWHIFAADPSRLDAAEQAITWLAARDIGVRGHTLMWPSFRFSPSHLRELADDPARLRDAINQHITSTAGRFSGQLIDWDVLNEPFNNVDIEKLLGREAFVEWFRLAREADPHARLFINDWGILASGNATRTEHQQHYADTIQFLIDSGAPIGGIGMQGHFSASLTEPENMLLILDRFGAFGLPILITELDVVTHDPQMQANFLRDVFIVCYSHPAVDGILQWGFWEGRHWQPQAALYSRDWQLRPHGRAFLDLIGEWKTDVTARTNAEGIVTVRGHLGDYIIEVGNARHSATLQREGTAIDITIE